LRFGDRRGGSVRLGRHVIFSRAAIITRNVNWSPGIGASL
jgi:hypothetical protein